TPRVRKPKEFTRPEGAGLFCLPTARSPTRRQLRPHKETFEIRNLLLAALPTNALPDQRLNDSTHAFASHDCCFGQGFGYLRTMIRNRGGDDVVAKFPGTRVR